MSFWERITRSNFFIRLRHWEYWPFGVVHFPAFLYWFLLSIRARSFVFFSGTNPGIPMGGMFGESKYEVLKLVPSRYVPPTLLMERPLSAGEVLARIQRAGLALPLIFKPDIGERGYMVRKISDQDGIETYLRATRVNFLVQELLEMPLEFGLFYVRFPGESTGKITSIVAKEMLFVTGDGKSTLKQLIFQKDRAKLQWKNLRNSFAEKLNDVIPAGEKVELVSIGNHALGTKFINANHLINEQLTRTFNEISIKIPGFYYGRFDLRCGSLEDLYAGKVMVMELNGCGAEPAHIYDPDFSLVKAATTLLSHWTKIFQIAEWNRRNGIAYVTHKEALRYYRKFRSAMQ